MKNISGFPIITFAMLVYMSMQRRLKKREIPKIDIYRDWCKRCGICVAFCPTRTLAKDEAGNPFVKDIEKCINCGLCELRCPDFAITVEKKGDGRKRHREKGEKEPITSGTPSGK
jgi:2-oxoglutarate ferredoxin oxidoreductase subunit delta